MFRKSKIEPVEKVKIVERYLAGEIGIQQAGKELGVDHLIIIVFEIGFLFTTIECKSNDFRKPYDSYLYSHRTPSETWKENRVITEVC